MNTISNLKPILENENMEYEKCLELKNFPIKMGVTDSKIENDLYANMTFYIDKNTGMIQLGELIPQDLLYSDAHYNNVASSWMEHHRAFADFVSKYHPQKVFEIGGGTGLLSYCYEKCEEAEWTILESAPNPVKGCKAKFIQGLFDEKYKIQGNYDAVIHSHTMEHFYKPLQVIKNIANSMPTGSFMFFSVPNMEEIFSRRYTNVMNFEHWYYCSEPYISNILNLAGYEVLERKLFKEEHSVFYAARLTNLVRQIANYDGLYEKNKKLLFDWKKYHQDLVNQINESLKKYENHKIYLFGAHVYAQFLIAFGLDTENIECVLDNDSSKQGHRLYGTNYQVFSTDILLKEKEPVIILHAGTHNGEIKEGIVKKNNTVLFV